jgi:ABC-2 type transport system ATP-binding protein
MAVIEVLAAHKSYRRWRRPPTKAVDGLDLHVEAGGVHGFLGPNGSGKTTTIRMLLGLVHPDSGELRVLDRAVPEKLAQVVGDVGALVETPLFSPHFSGRLNLTLLADVAGVATSRVEECLELVGLRDRADDRFTAYSLGMKQRLGIAAALLKNPRLLILDEPTNGLDPAGIREVRELIRHLGREGRTTVCLSSHLLGEVAQVCDSVTIVAHGRRVASGRVSEVLATAGTADVRLRVPEHVLGGQVLVAAGFSVTDAGDAWLVHNVPDAAAITRTLATAGHFVRELTPVSPDLESVFLQLTGDVPDQAQEDMP